METPRAAGSKWVTSLPPMATDPEVVVSRPATRRRMVDLPQPEGPSNTVRLASGTVKDTWSTAGTSVQSLVSSWMSMRLMGFDLRCR